MSTTNILRLPLHFSSSEFAYEDYKDFSGGTNLYRPKAWYFSNANDGLAYGSAIIPESFDVAATAKVRLLFASPVAGAAGENVKFEFNYRTYTNADSADPASSEEAVSVTTSIASIAAKTWILAEMDITEANWNPGHFIEYRLNRNNAVTGNQAQIIMVGGLWLKAGF